MKHISKRHIPIVIPALCRDPPGGSVMGKRLEGHTVRLGRPRHKAGVTV